MPRQIDRRKRQPALRVRRPQVPRAGVLRERGLRGPLPQLRQARVVRDEERLDGRPLEPLGAVPGHVLDGGEGAVGEEEEVEPAVADDGVVGALDDAGERAQRAGRGPVPVREDVVLAAHGVVRRRRVEGGLHVGAVEVVVWPAGQRGEAHLVPEVGAVVGQVVDVEAWVDVVRGGDDRVPDVAAGGLRAGRRGQFALGRVGEGVLHEFDVPALRGAFVDLGHECFVEWNDVLEVVQGQDGGCCCS